MSSSRLGGKEGPLLKKGHINKQWKKRYFALEGTELRYYKTFQEKSLAGKPQGSIPIVNARILPLNADDCDKEFGIGITPPLSTRTYVVAAASESERAEWLTELAKFGVVSHPEAKKDAGPDASVNAKVDPRSLKEGYLYKRGNTIKTWHRRYFVLFGHVLQYFKRKGDVVPAGEIDLRAGCIAQKEDVKEDLLASSVATSPPPPHHSRSASETAANDALAPRFYFSLQPLVPGRTRKYMICALADATRTEWINIITKVSPITATPAALKWLEAADGSHTVEEQEAAAPLSPRTHVTKAAAFMRRLSNMSATSASSVDDKDDDSGGSGKRKAPRRTQHAVSMGGPPAAGPGRSTVSIREGQLAKCGGFIKSWKTRYFVLESSPRLRTLKYFRARADEKPLGELAITDATVVQYQDDSSEHPNCFSVQSLAGARKYLMSADSAAEREKWVSALRAAVLGHNMVLRMIRGSVRSPAAAILSDSEADEEDDEVTEDGISGGAPLPTVREQAEIGSLKDSASALNVVTPPVVVSGSLEEDKALTISTGPDEQPEAGFVDPNSTLEGWLLKFTENNKQYSNKYVVLVGDALHYFKGKPTKDTLSVHKKIPLRGATVGDEDKKKYSAAHCECVFSVEPLNLGRKYVLASLTEADGRRWKEAIKTQIKSMEAQLVRQDCIIEGYLSSLRPDFSWLRGYYVATGGTLPCLKHYKSQVDAAEDKLEASMSLFGCDIQLVANDRYNRPCCFIIILNSGEDQVVLSADNREDMEDWVEALTTGTDPAQQQQQQHATPHDLTLSPLHHAPSGSSLLTRSGSDISVSTTAVEEEDDDAWDAAIASRDAQRTEAEKNAERGGGGGGGGGGTGGGRDRVTMRGARQQPVEEDSSDVSEDEMVMRNNAKQAR